jgi:hypothetical protein
MESSLTAALMKYGSDIQLKEKQKEILEYVYQGRKNLIRKYFIIFLGKGLFSHPIHNPGRITSILTHINTFISELVFSHGERHEAFRMISI